MPLSLAMDQQPSPSSTTSHLLQLAGWPVCVGAGAVGFVVVGFDDVVGSDDVLVVASLTLDRPTQYACPSQKLVIQSLETAGFQA